MTEPQVTLHPVPIPEQPDLSGIIGTECLQTLDPIDRPDLLALHVAQLTGMVAYLYTVIEDLRNGPGSDQD